MVCGMACVHATTEASDLCRFAAACTPTPSRAVSSRSSRTAGNFIAAPPTAAAGSAIHYRQDVDSEAEHATVAEHAPRQLSPTMRDCASGALFPQLRVALCAVCCTVYAGCTLVTICMMLQQVVCCTLDFARRMRTSAWAALALSTFVSTSSSARRFTRRHVHLSQYPMACACACEPTASDPPLSFSLRLQPGFNGSATAAALSVRLPMDGFAKLKRNATGRRVFPIRGRREDDLRIRTPLYARATPAPRTATPLVYRLTYSLTLQCLPRQWSDASADSR
jgi:hypothetical protein